MSKGVSTIFLVHATTLVPAPSLLVHHSHATTRMCMECAVHAPLFAPWVEAEPPPSDSRLDVCTMVRSTMIHDGGCFCIVVLAELYLMQMPVATRNPPLS